VRLEAGGGLHYAVFNYSDGPVVETIPLERLGLDPSGAFTARELWSGAQVDAKAAFTLPAKDVALFKISPR
jgi:hypothetical protein